MTKGSIMKANRVAIGLLIGPAAVAAIALHSPARAQEQEQGLRAGWQPFLGCWQPMAAEEEGQGIPCLIAGGRDVEMLTVVDGEIEFGEPLVADGADIPAARPSPVRAAGWRCAREIRHHRRRRDRRLAQRRRRRGDGMAGRGRAAVRGSERRGASSCPHHRWRRRGHPRPQPAEGERQARSGRRGQGLPQARIHQVLRLQGRGQVILLRGRHRPQGRTAWRQVAGGT